MKKQAIIEMPFFYDTYINLVSDEVEVLEELKATKDVLESFRDELLACQDYSYEVGKWTTKDVLQHMIDTERVMAYRALALARGEQQVLLGYEQDAYAKNTLANTRTIAHLLEEFALVRATTIVLFKSFSENMLLKSGKCSGALVTPLVFGFVCIGHAKHHMWVLQEKYFNKAF